MNKASSYFISASILLLLLSGASACSKRYQDLPVFSPFLFSDSENESVGRFKTSYMADQIHAYFRGNLNGTLAVTTFVDLDNLYESSTFGRILAEQLMSELTMRGYNVVEMRQAEAVQIMYDKGELALSRDTATLKRNQDISAIVVGTYAISPVRVYVNARVIDPASSLISSVGSVEMQKTSEIARLLRTNTIAPTMERIPVRHLGYTTSPAPHYWLYNFPPNWSPVMPWTNHDPEETSAPLPAPQLEPAPKLESEKKAENKTADEKNASNAQAAGAEPSS